MVDLTPVQRFTKLFMAEMRERTVLFANDSIVDGPIEDVVAAAMAAIRDCFGERDGA